MGATRRLGEAGRAVALSSLFESDEALVTRRVVVQPRDVVYLKGILEASRGLATLLAEGGGELSLVTTRSRARELDACIDDLADEVGLRRRASASGSVAGRAAHGAEHE